MLDAARGLFLEHGYAATTVAEIARRANVAPDTVYATFRTKLAVLKAVLDVVVGGDDQDVPVLERRGPQLMREETDQRRQLTMFAAGITTQLERIRPMDDVLRGAAAVDAQAAQLRDDVQLRQRREAMRTVVGWVASRGPLRPRLTKDRATSIVWTLTSPEVHRMLREHSGFSRAAYQRWLTDALVRQLLPDPGD